MDSFTWFRENKSDYVPSTYDRFLAYKRSLEAEKPDGPLWNGFTLNKFMCYFIYFSPTRQSPLSFHNPYTNQSISIPHGMPLIS